MADKKKIGRPVKSINDRKHTLIFYVPGKYLKKTRKIITPIIAAIVKEGVPDEEVILD